MTVFWRGVTAVLLVVAAALAGLLVYRQVSPGVRGGDALDTPLALPPLPLVSDRGTATTLAASDGRVRLVFYGFVRCPDVCPATLASLKNSVAALSPQQRARVQVQFITVDPGNDTPAVVRAYLDRFDPAFTGLTGKAATIDEAARVMFVANVAPMPAGDHGAHLDATHPDGTHLDGAHLDGTGQGAGSEQNAQAGMAARLHGDQVSVVDRQGRFVRVYGNGAVVDGTLDRDLPGLIRAYAAP
ncbi:SCO family protein [Deinococcus sp.]|uniref:SCO family protein n=1 Tax=Deinococcus sp. TaxID=47478 RepID=UPI0025BA80F5|nr:SCO family protein [Deinococcus sp.]